MLAPYVIFCVIIKLIISCQYHFVVAMAAILNTFSKQIYLDKTKKLY